MATGPFDVYNNGLLNLLDGTADFLSDDLRVALLLATYTPDLAAHDFLNDVSAHECADGGYSRLILGSKTLALAGSPVKVRFDSANFNWEATDTIP